MAWGIIGLVTFLGCVALADYFLGRSAGKKAAENNQLTEQVDAAKRIAKAEADAPVSRADLVDRLRKPGGGL